MKKKKDVQPAGWEGVCYLMFEELNSRLGKRKYKGFFGEVSFNEKLVFAYVALCAKIQQQLIDSEQLVDYVEINHEDGAASIRLDRCQYGELQVQYPADCALVMKSVQDVMRPQNSHARLRMYLTRHSLEVLLMDAEARLISLLEKHLAINDPWYIEFKAKCEETLGGDPQTVQADFDAHCHGNIMFFGSPRELNKAILRDRLSFLINRNPELNKLQIRYFIRSFRRLQKGIQTELRITDLKTYEKIFKNEFPYIENSQIILNILNMQRGGIKGHQRSDEVDLLRIGGYLPHRRPESEAEFTQNKLTQILKEVESIGEKISNMCIRSVRYGRYAQIPGELDIIEQGPSFI